MLSMDLPLVIETDSNVVVKALDPSWKDRSEIGVIAREFKAIKKGSREVKVRKVHRRVNSLAHRLA